LRRRPAPLPGIDGIRALSVTAVLVYHLDTTWLPGGYLGVDVFFVISGYLITRLLLTERAGTGQVSLRHFWTRRARRILAPLFPMLLAVVIGTALVDRSTMHALRTDVLGALTFTSNWVQIGQHQSYFAKFGEPSSLQHLWSLAVEEQFYLVWPLIVVALLYRGRRQLAVVAGLGAIGSAAAMAVLYQPGADPSHVYYSTATHSAGLLIGAVLAIAWPAASAQSEPRSRRKIAVSTTLAGIGLGGIAAGYWLLDEQGDAAYMGGIAAVSLASALLIVGAGHGHTPIGRLLSRPAVRWVGLRSYGLYLWHWPVLVLGNQLFGRRTLLTAAIEVTLAVLLAAASYRWIERPVLRYGYSGALARTWRSIPGPGAARRGGMVLGASAVAASCVFALVALVRPPASPTSDLEQHLAAADLALQQAPTPPPSPPAAPSPTPGPSAPPPGDQISALGDSVMLAASPALLTRFPGIQIDATVSRAMQAAPGILSSWARTGALRPVVLLGLGTNGGFPREVLESILTELGSGRKVYLVNVFLPTRPWGDGVNQTLTSVADTHPNVRLVDWQSAAGGHEDLLYTDKIHPRDGAGADLYAQAVLEEMTTPEPPPVPAGAQPQPPMVGPPALAAEQPVADPSAAERPGGIFSGLALAVVLTMLSVAASVAVGARMATARDGVGGLPGHRTNGVKAYHGTGLELLFSIAASTGVAWLLLWLRDRARAPP
jgi:peptidoglycan/LPS O-acetylase OafA/YrhL